ncbi:MAG: acyltransferase [Dechloromonas agitata]|uniref:Acyltransferase n=1 Tax=Dechloromonas agitata TaxID=73030 RepID=A0A930BPX3_9RHOO|nr:acyltransferase [Dechloromonas agitata]
MTSPLQPSFIQALRAFAALTILWHHFALYAPLSEWAAPLLGDLLSWLAKYARATQVFFVVSGFVAAQTIGNRVWRFNQLGRFVIQRYCRLGLPYLAIVLAILPIYELARGWVPDEVLGQPVTLTQFLAHLFFLQDILGYEALSAGLWFVCINFQLGFGYAFGMVLQQRFGKGGDGLFTLLGWGSSIYSLFHFNLDPSGESWALYFFPYFFLGILVHKAVMRRAGRELLAFQGLMLLAVLYEWRWRVVIAMVFGMVLFVAERSGLGQRWPRSRWIAALGKISFSLFLVHFPVLVLVGALWARLGWTAPEMAVAGLLVAFLTSLACAAAFHRWVETPAATLSRRFRAPRLEGGSGGGGSSGERRMAFEH